MSSATATNSVFERQFQALDRSQAFYHSLVESLPQSIVCKSTDGRLTFANQKFCDLIGKPLPEIIGRTSFDLFPADLAQQSQQNDQRVMDRGQKYEGTEQLQTAGGQRLCMHALKTPIYSAANEVLGVRCIFWDVGDHNRGEDALRESEEQFRLLFEQAPIAYHEIDTEGIVTRANQAECHLLGYQASEIVGKHIWDFVAPEVQANSREAVRKKIAEEQALVSFTRDYLRHDGTLLVLEIHENLIRDQKGAVAGIRSSLVDITARKRAEEALARQAQELARSNSELEQFAYVASHDLQEPLRKIQAFGDLLKTKCAETLSDQGRDYLARMQNAAARMQTLINDLLSFSRVRTRGQQFAPVNLGDVAREVLSDLEVSINHHGAQVEVGSLMVIHADRLQMSQLLQNLIGNALKFHRPGESPRVRVHGRLLAIEGAPHAGTAPVPLRYQLIVEDNGIGFDEKYLDRIFQVFQRLHGRGEYAGTGIGLAICRHIAERHGGSITGKSAPGMGSQFIVTLPVEHAKETTDHE